MSLPAFLQACSGGTLLPVKVQPRASKTAIGEASGNELRIHVTAPPVDSAANEALVLLLAEVLDHPRSGMQLLRGKTSRHKQVLVQGLTVVEVAAKLTK